MKSNTIATTIEQSKRLLELGLSPERADMIYWKISEDKYYELENIVWLDSVNTLRRKGLVSFDESKIEIIPAWSLSSLLELIPDSLDINEHFCLFSLTHYSSEYYDAETTEIIVANNKPSSPIEAAYNMVVWLLENNFI